MIMKNISKKKKIIAAILSIIVLLLISFLVYVNVFDKKDEKKPEEEEEPVEDKYVIPTDYDSDTNKNISNENILVDGNGNRRNVSEKIKENHEDNGIIVDSLMIYSSGKHKDFANLTFNVTNKTGNNFRNLYIYFQFLDKDGNVISEFLISLPTLNDGDSITHSYDYYYHILDAYDYTIRYVDPNQEGGGAGM